MSVATYRAVSRVITWKVPIINRDFKELVFAVITVSLCFMVIVTDKANAGTAWNLVLFISGHFFGSAGKGQENGRTRRQVKSDSTSG